MDGKELLEGIVKARYRSVHAFAEVLARESGRPKSTLQTALQRFIRGDTVEPKRSTLARFWTNSAYNSTT